MSWTHRTPRATPKGRRVPSGAPNEAEGRPGEGLVMILFVSLLSALPSRVADGAPVTVRPREYDGPVRNPYKGFESRVRKPLRKYDKENRHFHRLGSVINIRDNCPWKALEAHENDSKQRIVDHINALLEGFDDYNCSARFRVMGYNNRPPESTKLPRDLSLNDVLKQTPYYRRRYVNLIRKLGEVLDGDPRISVVEIGTGRWGEQHTPTPTAEAQADFGKAFTGAFTQTHVVNRNLGQFKEFTNFGYFNDAQFCAESCGVSMERRMVRERPDRWKSRPMEGEIALGFKGAPYPNRDFMRLLRNEKAVLRVINVIRYNHILHSCIFSTWQKHFPGWDNLTEQERERMFRIHKAFGYRFVMTEFKYESRLSRRNTFNVSFKVKNAGASPMYYPWRVALSLLNRSTRKPVWEEYFENVDIRTWIGGEKYPVDPDSKYENFQSVVHEYRVPAPTYAVKSSFRLPGNIPSGTYIIALSVHNPAGKSRLRFAIENYFNGGRHPMGYVGVNREPRQTHVDSSHFDDIFSDPFCDPTAPRTPRRRSRRARQRTGPEPRR